MYSLYLKWFRKHDVIKVYFVGKDKKVHVKWVLPKEDKVVFNGMTFIVIPEKVYLHKGVTCMFVNPNNAEPIDLDKIDYHVKSATDFNKALGTKVVEDLIAANKKKENIPFTVIISVLTIVAVGYSIYTMNNQLKEVLERLEEVYRLLGGQ